MTKLRFFNRNTWGLKRCGPGRAGIYPLECHPGRNAALIQGGKDSEARARSQYDGVGGEQADIVINAADVVSTFASNKASELIANAQESTQTLNRNLLLVLALVVLIILLTNYILIRNIHRPLDEMTQATKAFTGRQPAISQQL